MKYNWITKNITKKEWDEAYSKNSSYVLLGRTGNVGETGRIRGRIKIGFMSARDPVPEDCQLATKEELEKIKVWYENNNIYPRP